MTVLFSDDISGSGSASWTGQHVQYALVRIITVGSLARPLETADPDHFLRLGWISWGALITGDDAIERVYYDPPVWIDFLNWRWHPDPQVWTDPTDFSIWASHIRWSLQYGTTAHLLVSGG